MSADRCKVEILMRNELGLDLKLFGCNKWITSKRYGRPKSFWVWYGTNEYHLPRTIPSPTRWQYGYGQQSEEMPSLADYDWYMGGWFTYRADGVGAITCAWEIPKEGVKNGDDPFCWTTTGSIRLTSKILHGDGGFNMCTDVTIERTS